MRKKGTNGICAWAVNHLKMQHPAALGKKKKKKNARALRRTFNGNKIYSRLPKPEVLHPFFFFSFHSSYHAKIYVFNFLFCFGRSTRCDFTIIFTSTTLGDFVNFIPRAHLKRRLDYNIIFRRVYLWLDICVAKSWYLWKMICSLDRCTSFLFYLFFFSFLFKFLKWYKLYVLCLCVLRLTYLLSPKTFQLVASRRVLFIYYFFFHSTATLM